MEEKVKLEQLLTHVKEYGEERLNLAMLNVKEKTAKAVAGSSIVLILVVLGVFTLALFSFAFAWLIGQALEQPYLGFLIVGGVYLLAFILLWANREKWIGMPVMNIFLRQISDDDED